MIYPYATTGVHGVVFVETGVHAVPASDIGIQATELKSFTGTQSVAKAAVSAENAAAEKADSLNTVISL
jgi:hypothetical protein